MDIKLKNNEKIAKLCFAAAIILAALMTVRRYSAAVTIGRIGQSTYVDYRNEVVFSVIVVFLFIFALSGIILPAFKQFNFGKSRIFKTPLEVVVITGGLCFAVLTNMAPTIIEDSASGYLTEGIANMYNIAPLAAKIIIMGFNIAAWCFGFFAAYWGFACIRQVFDLGIFGYILERTLIGSVIKSGIKSLIGKYDSFEKFILSTDFTSKPLKKIMAVIFINFAAFIGMGMILPIFSSGSLRIYMIFLVLITFIYSFFAFVLFKKAYDTAHKDYEELIGNMDKIAAGEYIWQAEAKGVFKTAEQKLVHIGEGFNAAVEREVASQKTKTELITNVSHDLKTPLTAIITYINLLEEASISEEERKNHLEVLKRKSNRLKILIEDLFEVSKASTGDISLDIKEIDVVSILKELKLELDEKIQESGIDFKWELPDEKIMLELDGQKTYRIFENLIINIIKYGMEKTRAYIEAAESDSIVTVRFINISREELNQEAKSLTERFVRGDKSRNTEGSGLGLAIAKSLTELQGGKFDIIINKDLFTVEIQFER